MRTLVLLDNDLYDSLGLPLALQKLNDPNMDFEYEEIESSGDLLDLAFDKLAGTYERLVLTCSEANREKLLQHVQGVQSGTWKIIDKIATFEILHIGLAAKPFPLVSIGQIVLDDPIQPSLENLIFAIENGARHFAENLTIYDHPEPSEEMLDRLMMLVDGKTPIDSHLAAAELNLNHDLVVLAIKQLGKQGRIEIAEYQGGIWMIWSKLSS